MPIFFADADRRYLFSIAAAFFAIFARLIFTPLIALPSLFAAFSLFFRLAFRLRWRCPRQRLPRKIS